MRKEEKEEFEIQILLQMMMMNDLYVRMKSRDLIIMLPERYDYYKNKSNVERNHVVYLWEV